MTREKVKKLLAREIPPMKDGAHNIAGKYNNAGLWVPHESFKVKGTFEVRGPSRKWPYSYLRYFYTKAYSKEFLKHEPNLWFQTQSIDPNSEFGRKCFQWYVAHRLWVVD